VVSDPQPKNVLSSGPEGVTPREFWSADFDCQVGDPVPFVLGGERAACGSQATQDPGVYNVPISFACHEELQICNITCMMCIRFIGNADTPVNLHGQSEPGGCAPVHEFARIALLGGRFRAQLSPSASCENRVF